jgi:hypothetical protein
MEMEVDVDASCQNISIFVLNEGRKNDSPGEHQSWKPFNCFG